MTKAKVDSLRTAVFFALYVIIVMGTPLIPIIHKVIPATSRPAQIGLDLLCLLVSAASMIGGYYLLKWSRGELKDHNSNDRNHAETNRFVHVIHGLAGIALMIVGCIGFVAGVGFWSPPTWITITATTILTTWVIFSFFKMECTD